MSIRVMEEELINLDVVLHNNASYIFHTILLEFLLHQQHIITLHKCPP